MRTILRWLGYAMILAGIPLSLLCIPAQVFLPFALFGVAGPLFIVAGALLVIAGRKPK